MIKNEIVKFVALSLVIAASAALLACTSEESERETVTVELDWYPNANHSGIFVAQDQGYFDEENLDVDVRPPADPALVAQIVASNERDFGIFYQTDTLLARNEGLPIVALKAIVQRPLNSLMALESSGIARPSDLKGKKVGYPGIEWNVKMLGTMLESDGLTLDDVETVDIGWALWETLASGTVDAIIGAYWSHESILLEQKGYPVTVIYPEDYGVPQYYEMMLVTSERMLEERPDAVERFVRGFTKGYEYGLDDPQGAIDILLELNPEQEEIEDIERPSIDLLTDQAWLADETGEFGTMTEARWRSVAQFMKEQGEIDANLDESEAWTDEFLD